MAFAPYNQPKVAIVVYVENGGFRATITVPMARLMLERYFYGEVTPESKGMYEDRILNTVILPSHVP